MLRNRVHYRSHTSSWQLRRKGQLCVLVITAQLMTVSAFSQTATQPNAADGDARAVNVVWKPTGSVAGRAQEDAAGKPSANPRTEEPAAFPQILELMQAEDVADLNVDSPTRDTQIQKSAYVPPPAELEADADSELQQLGPTDRPQPIPSSGCDRVTSCHLSGCDISGCDTVANEMLCEQILQDSSCADSEMLYMGEYPIAAYHRAMETLCWGNRTPFAQRWIYWKHRYENPGPIACCFQSTFVNWRLSSMYLMGCMPDGYALQCFIETVPNVEFHTTMLHSNGPVDPGGSIEEAKQIEGSETKSLQQISLNIAPTQGDLPADRAEEQFDAARLQVHIPGSHRQWCGTSFYWQASLLNHQPLYFEDVNLERHGFSYGCWQPLVSGAKFFTRVPALPYLMTAYPHHETEYTLGETRPGNHAWYVAERLPLRLDAAAVEAGAVLGLVFLIP